MNAEEPNIELFLHIWSSDILMDGERITGLPVRRRNLLGHWPHAAGISAALSVLNNDGKVREATSWGCRIP